MGLKVGWGWANCESGWWSLKYDTHLPALWEEGSSEEQWPLPALLSGRKLPVPASSHRRARLFSSSLYVSAALVLEFKGNAGGQVSLCADPLRGTSWDSRSPMFHSATIPTGFYSQNLWGLLFLALESWARRPGMGQGPLLPRYPSQFLSPTHGSGTSPFHVLAISYQSQYGILFFLVFCYLLISRERGRKGGKRRWEISVWERNIDWLILVCTLTRDWTHNPDISPDWESRR